jgi:hypothetical protein
VAFLGVAAAGLATAIWIRGRRVEPPAASVEASGAPLAPEVPDAGAEPALDLAALAALTARAGAHLTCEGGASSAFFLAPEYALTAAACPRGAEAQLRLGDGRELLGRVAWRDERLGLAAVEVPGAAVRPLLPGDSTGLASGEAVFLAVDAGSAFALREAKVDRVGRNLLGVACLELEPGALVDAAGAPLLDGRGRLLGLLPSEIAEPEQLGLAVPVEYLAAGVPGLAVPAPEAAERWRRILEQVEGEDRRDAEAYAGRFAKPALVQVSAAGGSRLEGLVLRRWPVAARPDEAAVEVREEGRAVCAAKGAVRSWTVLPQGLHRLDRALARRARWAVERGVARDLYLGVLEVELTGCPAERLSPSAAVALAEGEEPERPVGFPRAALLEEAARKEEQRAAEERQLRQREETAQEEARAEVAWRQSFRQAHERIAELEDRRRGLKERQEWASTHAQWIELDQAQQEEREAEGSLRRAEEELDELERQASRQAVPREWRQ